MTMVPWWQEVLSHSPLHQEGLRCFFVDSPDDAFVDIQENVLPSRWTRMRWSHYEWLGKEMAKLPKGRRILDIGCGQSQFQNLYIEHDLCGIDFIPYKGANIVADLNRSLPLLDGVCDVAILSNVLEHVYEPQVLLREVYRVLKPGGVVLLVVPFMIKLHQKPYDFFRYTNFALERMFGDRGFVSTRVEPLGNLFDIYDLDRKVRSNILRRESCGWRRLVIRCLLRLGRECDQLSERLSPEALRTAPDQDGFPHSFAVYSMK